MDDVGGEGVGIRRWWVRVARATVAAVGGPGAGLPDWPQWCWVPMAGAVSVVSAAPGPAKDIARVAALAAWSIGRGLCAVLPPPIVLVRPHQTAPGQLRIQKGVTGGTGLRPVYPPHDLLLRVPGDPPTHRRPAAPRPAPTTTTAAAPARTVLVGAVAAVAVVRDRWCR